MFYLCKLNKLFHAEFHMKKKILIALITILSATGSFAQSDYIFPAEFDKNEGVLLTWDYHPDRNPITAAIAKAVQNSAKVWIIYYPGQAPEDTSGIRQYLYSQGVTDHNVYFIPAWTETIWIRDYGPLAGYDHTNGGYDNMFVDLQYSGYNRPKDDSIPDQIGRQWSIPVMEMPLNVEGGNIMLDGLGRGFGSKRIWDQNPGFSPTQIGDMLMAQFGLYDFVFMDKLTNSGGGIWMHVDMYMKVVDNKTILVSQYPEYVPDYPVIESMVQMLSELVNVLGQNYDIVRIPAPPKADGTYAMTQNDEMRTYTNSLFMNDVVVVPSYNLPEYDSAAKHIYESLLPGYQVKMVDATQLTPLYGAIHCITREIPQHEYLKIKHTKVTGPQNYLKDFTIRTACQSANNLDSMLLRYRVNSSSRWNTLRFVPSCPYSHATIENLGPSDTVHYYIEIKTATNSVTDPLPAPNGFYSFWFYNTVGVEELNNAVINIFPVPAQNHVTVELPGIRKGSLLTISDLLGHEVFKTTIDSEVISLSLPENLKSGIYFLTVSSEGYSAFRKFFLSN